MPASHTTSSTGSERLAAARDESSRSAANTARGEESTSARRSHQSRAGASGATPASALIPAPGAGEAGTSAPWSLRPAYGCGSRLGHELAVVAAVLHLPEAEAALAERRLAVGADRVVAAHVGGNAAGHEQRRDDDGESDQNSLAHLAAHAGRTRADAFHGRHATPRPPRAARAAGAGNG